MISLYRGQVGTVESPAVVWPVSTVLGMLINADALSYTLTGTASNGSAVTLSEGEFEGSELTPYLVGSGKGRYSLPITIPSNAPVGPCTLSVTWTNLEQDDVGNLVSKTRSASKEVEVVERRLPALDGKHLCLLSRLREEGISATALPDARAARLIARASRYVERETGVEFTAQFKQFQLDRQFGRVIRLGEAIVAIDHMASTALDIDMVINRLTIYNAPFVVYSRHITQNLRNPDDRWDPRIIIGGTTWAGFQTLRLFGLFGYTDYDGTCEGETPEEIQEVCVRMVQRYMAGIGSDEEEDARNAAFVVSESTSRQSVSYDAKRVGSGPTGDRNIDSILEKYRPPIAMRCV